MQSFKHDLINYDHLKSAKMMFMLFELRSDFFINKISNKNHRQERFLKNKSRLAFVIGNCSQN
jgi:hypothetical protein